MDDTARRRDIVIIGGGIIGCCSAYFLTRHPSYDPAKHTVTILEASKIAGGASGKAGGLLALWAYPKSIVPLSYRLHAELAKEHGGVERWGYRGVNCGQLAAKGRSPKELSSSSNGSDAASVSLQKRSPEALARLRKAGIPPDLDWVSDSSAVAYSAMGDPSDTAQVHPYQFTTAMAELAQEAGARIILGRVTEIQRSSDSADSDGDGAVQAVHYIPSSASSAAEQQPPASTTTKATKTIPATDVVLAAGPWTANVLPSAPISALRAHSVTIRPTRPLSAYALFTDISLPTHSTLRHSASATPEIYARPNNEIYACGEGDTLVPLPATTADVETDPQRAAAIVEQVGGLSDELREGEVLVRQACYLPQVEHATVSGPLVGLTRTKGLVLAAGHTCWGIQNGPGTGKLVSEFVFDNGARSAKVAALDPRQVL